MGNLDRQVLLGRKRHVDIKVPVVNKLVWADLSPYGDDVRAGLWHVVDLAQEMELFSEQPSHPERALSLAHSFLASLGRQRTAIAATVGEDLTWASLQTASVTSDLGQIEAALQERLQAAELLIQNSPELLNLILPPLWPIRGRIAIACHPIVTWPPNVADDLSEKNTDIAWRAYCQVEKRVREALIFEISSAAGMSGTPAPSMLDLLHLYAIGYWPFFKPNEGLVVARFPGVISTPAPKPNVPRGP